jgi:hypothetical protein
MPRISSFLASPLIKIQVPFLWKDMAPPPIFLFYFHYVSVYVDFGNFFNDRVSHILCRIIAPLFVSLVFWKLCEFVCPIPCLHIAEPANQPRRDRAGGSRRCAPRHPAAVCQRGDDGDIAACPPLPPHRRGYSDTGPGALAAPLACSSSRLLCATIELKLGFRTPIFFIWYPAQFIFRCQVILTDFLRHNFFLLCYQNKKLSFFYTI